MKKTTFLLSLIVCSIGFGQSPFATKADYSNYISLQEKNLSQATPPVDLPEEILQDPSILGNCIFEYFDGYILPVGGANFLPDVTMLDETTVVNGQGPGLVEDGCVYMSLAGPLQWNGVGFYGQVNQTIIASSTDASLTLEYDLTVDYVEFQLSAFDGFPDSVTIDVLDDAGISLGILGPVAVPESSLVLLEIDYPGIKTIKIVGIYDGVNGFSPLLNNHVFCPDGSAPSNDLCEDAVAVTCNDTFILDTSIATDTGGNAAPDVWYSYTGTGVEQNVTFSLCDGTSDFDSYIRVFDACDGTQIAENDDSCGLQSELTFVSNGTATYLIMIEGFSSDSGIFSLTISCDPENPAENDLCENALPVVCDAIVLGNTSSSNDTGGNVAPDVWYSFTGDGVVQNVTLSLCGGATGYDSLLRVFDACDGAEIEVNDDSCGVQSELTFTSNGTSTYLIMVEGSGSESGSFTLAVTCAFITPVNDLCQDATALACGDSLTGETNSATDTGGNPISPDVWYSYTGAGFSEDVTLSLCDGGTNYDSYIRLFDACDGTEIGTNDDWCGVQSELTFSSNGSSTYLIMIEGFGSQSGEFSLVVTCTTTGPQNDQCVDAIALDCGDTITGNTLQGTDSGGNLAADLWYSFTGQGIAQDVTASLCESDYDTLIRVFDACDGTEIATNDDSCGIQSELTFTSNGTSTYFIMVEGYASGAGEFTLELTCTPDNPETNDTCENATPVACGDVIIDTTSDATNTAGNAAPDLWYLFTGEGLEQEVRLSLCDGATDYDSYIRLFDTCGGAEIAANDDFCGTQSELTFLSDGTSTYHIMIEGFGSAFGDFSLAITCENTAGINENDFSNFTFFPNPAATMINYNANHSVEYIVLYNMLGQKVLQQSGTTISGQINIESLTVGSYIMQTTINGATQSFNVIKM